MTSWRYRSSVLSLANYAKLSVKSIIDQYVEDNEKANEEGVQIRPRSPSSKVRTLQWNIHAWTSPRFQNSPEITRGIMDAIFEADADVIVLNEYDWGDRDSRHSTFERKLREQGYDSFCRGTVFCPTAVATRFYVYETREIHLSEERSALALKVDKDKDIIWVIGTHLDHAHGPQRRKEIQALLQDLKQHFEEDERIIIVGDFNQQRQQDYSEEEWKLISDSMTGREKCQDDGVATLLKEADFTCAWDGLSTSKCNWETSKPPSTHWSGTIVDYSYGRHVEAEGVSISPAGWSDHRMQVCDWKW